MSRRDYRGDDRYDDRQSDYYRRPRRGRDHDDIDIDIDINNGRYPEESRSRVSRTPRQEAMVKERDTVIEDRRSERGPRQPDFLREDYGKTSAGPLVIREDKREEDVYSRAPTRRRSVETVRSRAPERVEEERIVIKEKERDRGPPYPRSERDFSEQDEFIFRERTRSRPPAQRERSDEEIDIKIKRREESRPPPRSEVTSRSDYKERDVEEIRFRRGGPPPPRTEVEQEEIRISETRSPPPRSEYRGRDRNLDIDIDIDINEGRRAPARRPRSVSRPQLVARDHEEWIVRRRKEPSPPPPPRDYEREEIIIRRKERSPSPAPPPPAPEYKKEELIIRRRERTPSPEPPPPPRDYEREQITIRRKERSPSPEPPPREPTPPPPPIIRPPIIQEVITHHRHIDHGIELARSPTPPPPPPAPPSPPREEELEIEIRRQGTRNGKYYDEDIIIERDTVERKGRDDRREVSRRRSISASTRRRSPSVSRKIDIDIDINEGRMAPPRSQRSVARPQRQYDDDVAAEADYYNRKVTQRGFPGEAYNGATKDWGLVDVPPGTERVRMDGLGGGRQELYWDRYKGERRGKFYAGDRVYEQGYGNGLPEAPPPPPPIEAPETVRETRITERRIVEDTHRGRTKDKMWTEITKDLVIKEAIDEMGYEYEETDDFFYVIEYLKYEDVLHLVEVTEDIRRQRRERLREIQWEREEMDRGPKMLPAPPLPNVAPKGKWDSYDREYVYERDRYRR